MNKTMRLVNAFLRKPTTGLLATALLITACEKEELIEDGTTNDKVEYFYSVTSPELYSSLYCSKDGGMSFYVVERKTTNDTLVTVDTINLVYICKREDSPNRRMYINLANNSKDSDCNPQFLTIKAGDDTNENKNLDEEEVENIASICYDSFERGALVGIIEEPNGQNCSKDGFKVEYGQDTDADGAIVGVEISEVVFYCDEHE